VSLLCKIIKKCLADLSAFHNRVVPLISVQVSVTIFVKKQLPGEKK